VSTVGFDTRQTRLGSVPSQGGLRAERRTAKQVSGQAHSAGRPSWIHCPGIIIATAALVAAIGTVVWGPGGQASTTRTSIHWPGSSPVVAVNWWEPTPESRSGPRQPWHLTKPCDNGLLASTDKTC
jgi:hypothetical protein